MNGECCALALVSTQLINIECAIPCYSAGPIWVCSKRSAQLKCQAARCVAVPLRLSSAFYFLSAAPWDFNFPAATRSRRNCQCACPGISDLSLQPQSHYLLPFVYVHLPYLHSRPAKAVPIYVHIFSCPFAVVLAAYQILHLVQLRVFSDIPLWLSSFCLFVCFFGLLREWFLMFCAGRSHCTDCTIEAIFGSLKCWSSFCWTHYTEAVR